MATESFVASRRQMLLAAAFIITVNSFSLSLSWSRPMTAKLSARHQSSPRSQSLLRTSAVADSGTQISNRLDPLLTSFLLRSVRSTNDDSTYRREINSDGGGHSQFTFSDASDATVGLRVWEASLAIPV
jgi:hypothetical protein